jgi:arylsulfatase A-like enzyme
VRGNPSLELPKETSEFLFELNVLCPYHLAIESLFFKDYFKMPKSPNVLVIFADQQLRFALGCMGNPDVDTPNLDRLAGRGAHFRSGYSATPVCSPFRVNLVTGRYGLETGAMGNGCVFPKGGHTLVEDFKKAGYGTGFIGKWHVGGNGNQPIPVEHRGGFENFIGYQCYNGFYQDVCFYDEEGKEHRFEKHRTDVTGDIAIERLGAMADEGPFMAVVGFQAPHYPEQPSPKYDRAYRGREVTPRPNYSGKCPYIRTHSPKSPQPVERDPDYRRYGEDIHEYLRCYYALCTQVDANVGRILDALEEKGVLEDTLVLFTADHGDLAGSHDLNGKCVSYEESAGIPFILAGPGVPEGLVIDEPVDSSSYMPTLMDLAGVEASEGLLERSRAFLLKDPKSPTRAFSSLNNWCMVREGSWKLTIEDEENRPTMLFDLESDPYEMNNLVDSPEGELMIKKLQPVVASWKEDCISFRQENYPDS